MVETNSERFSRLLMKTTKEQQIICSAIFRTGVPVHDTCAFGTNVKFLHADQCLKGTELELWFLDDYESPSEISYIRLFCDGEVVPEGYTHISSVRLRTGETWHIFRTMTKPEYYPTA